MDFFTNLNTTLNAQHIRNILSHLGERKLPSRKGDLAQRLHRVWLEEPHRLLNALSEPERLLLAECAHGGDPEPDIARLNAKHGFSYAIPYQGGWGGHHAILCFLSCDDFGRTYRLVDGVMDRLKSLLPAPPALTIASVPELPEEGRWTFEKWDKSLDHTTRVLRRYDSERVAPMEARRMLQLAAAGKLRVGEKTGLPSEAAQRMVAAALCAPDLDLTPPQSERQLRRESGADPRPVRAFAWPVLLQQCGWATAKAGKLALTRQGRELLDAFTFGRYAEGVRAFVSDSAFDELRHVTVIKGQSGRHASRGRIPAETRRHSIVECLAELPRDAWVEIEEAHRALIALGGEGRVVINGMCLYIAEARYGHLSGYEGALGRVYLRQLAGESLATLGLIDLGYAYPHYLHPELDGCWGLDDEPFTTRYDGLKYLRVTALGRFCLGVDPAYEPPEQEQRALFKVLPNMELVVTDAGGFSTADAAMLERFSAKVSDSVWRLDAATILDALASGQSAADILTTLESGSGVDVPDTVRRLIQETALRAGAVTDCEDAVIVTFRDEETAVLVAHDPRAGKIVLCREGRSLVVRARNRKGFQSALRNLGIILP